MLSIKIYDTEEKVLGFDCRIIELQKNRSRVKYYFSKELIMAPLTYEKHRSYNWNTYGEKTNGGLVLKLEHQFQTFTMHGIATMVEKAGTGFIALELSKEKFDEICAAGN